MRLREMKQQERLKRIREFLISNEPREVTWTEIFTATKILSKELASDLRKLIERGEVTSRKDTKDRRKTLYRLRDRKKANAEAKRSETAEFILNLKDPLYLELPHEIPYKEFKIHMKTGIFFEGKELEDISSLIGGINLSELLKGLSDVFEKVNKFALTMTFERNEKDQ